MASPPRLMNPFAVWSLTLVLFIGVFAFGYYSIWTTSEREQKNYLDQLVDSLLKLHSRDLEENRYRDFVESIGKFNANLYVEIDNGQRSYIYGQDKFRDVCIHKEIFVGSHYSSLVFCRSADFPIERLFGLIFVFVVVGGTSLFLVFKLDAKTNNQLRTYAKNAGLNIRHNSGLTEVLQQISANIYALEEAKKKEVENLKYEAIAKTTAHIAHDLKGPVNVFQTLVDENLVPQERKRAVSSALSRIHTMIEAFRDSDSDRIIRPHLSVIDFEGLAAEAQAGSQVDINARVSNHCEIFCDSAKIERVILNLLRNAIEAEASEVTVDVGLNEEDFEISVRDNGPGIPENLVEHIFDRGSSFGKKGGSGLGLSYCRDVIKGHGGKLTYKRVDKYSVFKFILPDSIAKSEDKKIEENIKPEQKTLKYQVLIDLDNKLNQRQLITMLPKIRFVEDPSQAKQSAVLVANDSSLLVESEGQCLAYEFFDKEVPVEQMAKKLNDTMDMVLEKAKSLGVNLAEV